MKTIAFAFLLLVATFAGAQTVSPVEQSYGPYLRPSDSANVSLAASKNKILLAWSEIDAATGRARIRTGLLDLNGRLVSPIETIPTAPTEYAVGPVVGNDGTSFVLLYTELGPPARTLLAVIDAAGHLAGSPRLLNSSALGPPTNVHVFWNGSSYFGYVDGTPSIFRSDGTPVAASMPELDSLAGVTVANGTFATASWIRVPVWQPPPCHIFCSIIGWTRNLTWTSGSRGATYAPKTQPQLTGEDLPVPPAIGTFGAETVIAWVNQGINYYVIDGTPRELATSLDADPDQQLGIACDAALCLVAYGTTSGDIYALALDVSREDYPRVLAVSTSGRREWHPSVFHLGNGRFLVAYYSDLAGDMRFAGRIIGPEPSPPSRRRSAH